MGVEREAPRAAAQPPRPSPMQKSSAALAQVFDEAGREPPSASSNGHITSAARDSESTSRPAPSHRQQVRLPLTLRHYLAFFGLLQKGTFAASSWHLCGRYQHRFLSATG